MMAPMGEERKQGEDLVRDEDREVGWDDDDAYEHQG